MQTVARLAVGAAAAAALTAPALAHHSAAAFNTQQTVTVVGTVTEYRFANPHVYMTLQVRKDDGSTVSMEVEAGAASVLNALGFNRDSVKVGEVVRITGNPGRREPERLLLGRELFKLDGGYVPLNISSKSVYQAKINATATSVEGTWFSTMGSFGGYMGQARKFALTDAGKAAAAKVAGPLNTTQKDCIPIGVPSVMFYPVATTITAEKDRVLVSVDWMDTERVVYLDGRPHPPATQTFLHGHSVGRWEGKALVVETTNFQDHGMGTSTSVPGSTQKKVTERFELSEDGKQLIYSGTVEDPLYLVQPGTWSGRLEYRPGMQHSQQKCDIEIAQRFLKD
jgi:hypothetical protein